MDRSLDESIAERQRNQTRNRRGFRRDYLPRDGVRKSTRDDRADLDRDWVHDKFDDDRASNKPSRGNRRNDRNDRYSPEQDTTQSTAKIRVDNLHYDLTEDDLQDLFERIAPVVSLSLRYDRAGRSEGTAYVTYESIRDARTAITEFDGANAKGQPIRLTLMPSAPAGRNRDLISRSNNPFDRVEKPARSLFDRVERPRSASPMSGDEDRSPDRRAGGRGRRGEVRDRRSDVSKPPPDGIDRYIPGQRSPTRRRGEGGRIPGRRPGERRENDGRRGGSRKGADREGHRLVNGRPRKTQEELDQEMEDYWGSGAPAENGTADVPQTEAAAEASGAALEDDIEMIE